MGLNRSPMHFKNLAKFPLQRWAVWRRCFPHNPQRNWALRPALCALESTDESAFANAPFARDTISPRPYQPAPEAAGADLRKTVPLKPREH